MCLYGVGGEKHWCLCEGCPRHRLSKPGNDVTRIFTSRRTSALDRTAQQPECCRVLLCGFMHILFVSCSTDGLGSPASARLPSQRKEPSIPLSHSGRRERCSDHMSVHLGRTRFVPSAVQCDNNSFFPIHLLVSSAQRVGVPNRGSRGPHSQSWNGSMT